MLASIEIPCMTDSDTTVLVFGENTFDFHRLDEKRPLFESFLDEEDIDATITTDLNALQCESINEFDAVIDYLTKSTFTTEQREGLLGFVRDGGGYVGVHCASDFSSFVAEPDEELESFVGGAFIDHPEQSEFAVRIRAEHPITTGIDDFTVFDEPYNLRWNGDVNVLARMDHPELGDVPVVWTRIEGDGRVCYCSLGHTNSAFEQQPFQQLVTRAIQWTAPADTIE
jgi:type 1 glutamine amidotransferase